MSIALGIVMSKLIEIPSLTVREKWFPALNRKAKNRAQPILDDLQGEQQGSRSDCGHS
jgi:hypothetical protein